MRDQHEVVANVTRLEARLKGVGGSVANLPKDLFEREEALSAELNRRGVFVPAAPQSASPQAKGANAGNLTFACRVAKSKPAPKMLEGATLTEQCRASRGAS